MDKENIILKDDDNNNINSLHIKSVKLIDKCFEFDKLGSDKRHKICESINMDDYKKMHRLYESNYFPKGNGMACLFFSDCHK